MHRPLADERQGGLGADERRRARERQVLHGHLERRRDAKRRLEDHRRLGGGELNADGFCGSAEQRKPHVGNPAFEEEQVLVQGQLGAFVERQALRRAAPCDGNTGRLRNAAQRQRRLREDLGVK